MMRVLLVAVALTTAACNGQPPSPATPPPAPGPTAEGMKKFTQLMEANDAQFAGLNEEAQRKAGLEAYRQRLARFKKLAQDASAIPVKEREEQKALDAEFETYLAILETLEKDPWDDPRANVKTIETACNRCHQKFQKED
jgi:hypothetical protein